MNPIIIGKKDIDRRTIPGETGESVEKEMRNLFRKLKIKSPDFSATRSVPCPPLDTDPSLDHTHASYTVSIFS